MLELLDQALAAETDAEIKGTMELARAVIVLKTDAHARGKARRGRHDRRAGQPRRADRADQLRSPTAPDELKPMIQAGINSIGRTLAVWDIGQNLLYGISLSSVLLLAAIGLAITFGVMGVINMAHGEMVMLGAYTTYRRADRDPAAVAPGLMDYSLRLRGAGRLPVHRRWSASPSSAASSAGSTAARSRRCSPPGACR